MLLPNSWIFVSITLYIYIANHNIRGVYVKDEPSIDSSEAAPKTEEPSTESKPAEAEAGAEEAAKPTEDKSEAAVEKKETEEEEKKKEEVKE